MHLMETTHSMVMKSRIAQVSAAQKNGTSWEYTITNMYTPPQNVQTSDTFAMNQWVFIFISSLCIVIGIRIVLYNSKGL